MRILALYFILIFTLVAAGNSAAVQNTPQPHSEHQAQAQGGKTAAQDDMMARCQQMMSERRGMMQRMQAMDKKLDDLLADMNKATDSRKVDAVAKVVTEMAAQRKQMRQDMMQMSDGMMSHMMEHMKSGSAAMCPMMKGMDSAPKK